MANPLTPNKIQRLINLAEDRSFNMPRRLLINDDDLNRLATMNQAALNRSNGTANCESSSGILDLDRMEGFGESGIGDLSLSKSTAFNPGEMTGRSTGADDVKSMPLGRHSLALDNITSQMDKQTSEIQDIMRHSIATNYSFHSKRDLTADEASLVAREAPLPIQNSTQVQFADNISMNNSNLSVGAYFKNRCPDFGRMLAKTDSPDRSCMPSITEVSGSHSDLQESGTLDKHPIHKMDQTLDCVPVRQPRNNIEEKSTNLGHTYEAQCSYRASNLGKFTEASNTKVPEKSDPFYLSQVLDKPKYVQMSLKSPKKNTQVPVNKETNLLIKNLQASLRIMSEDTEGSAENSLSISKIADYLGKQSNVSVTDMLQYNNQKKQVNKKQPLTELQVNIPETKKINRDFEVTNLKDTRKAETASSSGTINTVISLNQYKLNNLEGVPSVVVTQPSQKSEQLDVEDTKTNRTRSKSPSSKSRSTMSTVQENCASFKSGDSPLHTSKGEANTSHVSSPNIVYKELDKSVDWHEVLQQKRMKQDGLAKVSEQWVEVSATAVNGYVGASCPITVTVTTLVDSWLTARLKFIDLPNEGNDLSIELPRMPILLSPGKSEKITAYITSNIEINTTLQYIISLKDTSIDGDIEQEGKIELNIEMPVIQAMSSDGVNKITFPAIQENTSLTKSFVFLSSCPADLHLILSIVEAESVFTIKNVQEIKKSDVNKVLMDRQGLSDDQTAGKSKSKGTNKQLCRLTGGNAIRVTIKFSAPKLTEKQIEDSSFTCNGTLNITLIGVESVLRKVDLIGAVGTVNLVLNTSDNKLLLSHEPTNIEVCNKGSVSGIWIVKFKGNTPNDSFPFKIAPSKFEVRPGATKSVSMFYTGASDVACDATLIFEEIASGHITAIDISGGSDKQKVFPIKTNYTSMSWVRSGRKELSLKNTTDKKIYMRCQIVGDGFAIDLPRESRGIYCVPFGPCECRPLPIIFAPNSNTPQKATLHLVYDKNSDFSRKVLLYGCASEESMRWSGLVTYGDTALVRAISRTSINLELYNKSPTPAFVCARVHFNLQYRCLSRDATLSGARHVVRGRARHALALSPRWAALPRRAAPPASSALATLTVLTGSEFTRRRILKIVRDESDGKLDTSLLPDHLKVLAEKFEGEDDSMDQMIADFKETKASLNELIGGLQELTAQIDLPQDFAEENTILITDDTVVEHHTLCD